MAKSAVKVDHEEFYADMPQPVRRKSPPKLKAVQPAATEAPRAEKMRKIEERQKAEAERILGIAEAEIKHRIRFPKLYKLPAEKVAWMKANFAAAVAEHIEIVKRRRT
ncbi:MAG: hypothetical protein AB7O57_08365 [Hyphomicrobiaceae bacterium]